MASNPIQGSDDQDYRNRRGNMIVETAVRRGIKLRAEKPLPKKMQNDYDVFNIDLMGSPFCNQSRERRRNRNTRDCKCSTQNRNSRDCGCSTRATSSRTSAASSSAYPPKCANTPGSKKKYRKRCSMRIAELAVPSKRQLIDTWRNKADLLPQFMVERLKQHVLDQRPIVKIPEALYCFQRWKRSQRPINSPQDINDSIAEVRKPLKRLEIENICIIFAHRIAKELAMPLNINLSPRWQNLSNIVASEIAQILRGQNKTNLSYQQRKLILTDISNKITVWIAGILDDMSLKLLEEDLRVLKRESKVITSKHIETIIESILLQEMKYLEEEEGPVLDFIDDLVEKVLNICEPLPLFIFEESESSDSTKDGTEDSKKDNTEEAITPLSLEKETDYSYDPEEVLTDPEHFRKEINTMIDRIINESGDDYTEQESGYDNQEFRENISEESRNDSQEVRNNISKESMDDSETVRENTSKKSMDDSPEVRENTSKESIEDITRDLEDNYNKELEEEIDTDIKHDFNEETMVEVRDENTIDILRTSDIENEDVKSNDMLHKNEIEHIDSIELNDETTIEENIDTDMNETADEDSKNVKVSVTKLVSPDLQTHQFVISTQEVPDNNLKQDQHSLWKANSKLSVMFAEPNEHLLSDADETWPKDILDGPSFRLSQTVSKSVSSLGSIIEVDEKQVPLTKYKTEVKHKTDNIELQDYDQLETIKSIPSTGNTNSIITNEELPKAFKQGTNQSTEMTSENEKDTFIIFIEESPLDSGTGNSTIDANSAENIGDNNTSDDSQTHSNIFDDKYVDKLLPQQEKHKTGLNENHKYFISDNSEEIADTYGKPEDRNILDAKSQSQIDYGYKVHLKTAPSWVYSRIYDRGEPSEDSIPMQLRPTQVKESDLRKWCKDLEKAFIKLEMWNDWIRNSCKETEILLKRKKVSCNGWNRKIAADWIRHKKNIIKDAMLWTNMLQRTEYNFRSLKNKYNNIEFRSNRNTSTLANLTIKEAIIEVMSDIENISVALHRMIVSAEYCGMCTCNEFKDHLYSLRNKMSDKL